MSKRGGLDTGPLSWVKGEIDSAFKRGAESLRAFAGSIESGGADPLLLKAGHAHLHQAHGALQIVGIGGISRVTGELEALLTDMSGDPGKANAENIAAAQLALRAVGDYLDQLMKGAPNQTLKLLPVLSALAAARGQARADPVDLFFPDLSGRPPARDRAATNLHPDEVRQTLVEQRARYMRGLLKFLKSDRAGAAEMREAVIVIEQAQSTAPQRAFWWVAEAFFDALVHDVLPADIDPRRICNRIEQQIRRLGEGSPQVAERLIREALYYVARSSPASDSLRAVQEAFRLRQTIPGEESTAEEGESEGQTVIEAQQDKQNLAATGTDLRAIEQALDVYYRDPSRPLALAPVEIAVGNIARTFATQKEIRAAEVFAACMARIRRFAAPGYDINVRDFEEVAQTLSGFGFFVEALKQGPADFEALMRPVGDETARQETQAPPMLTIEAQLSRQFKAVQRQADEWRKSRSDGDRTAQLKKEAIAIQKDAAMVSDGVMEAVALGILKEIEAATPTGGAAAAAVIAPDAVEQTIDAELLDVYFEEAGEVLGTIAGTLASMRANPGDHDALITVRRGFHTLKGSGRMVGLTKLGEVAWAIEQTLNLWLQEEREVTGMLLDLVDSARDYFASTVALLRSGKPALSGEPLVARAEAVCKGDQLDARSSSNGQGALLEKVVAAIPPPEVATTTPAAPPEEEGAYVEIGGNRVSQSLFELFANEARGHVTTLKVEYEVLKGHGVITDAMMIAVHTLGGIAGTLGFDNLRDLAAVFDRALAALSLGPLSSDEEDLIELGIETTERMVVEALGLAEPTPAPELLDRLENIAAGAPQEAGPMTREEDEMTLPEEEGAIERDESEPPVPVPASPRFTPPSRGMAGAVELDDQPESERRQKRLGDEIDAQLLPIFLEEADELVPELAQSLRAWREEPDNKERAQAAKRVLHTLKGSARMAGAMSVGELSHHMETRIEESLALASASPRLFEDLDTSMDRMGFLFDKLQPEGGAAVAAARRVAPLPLADGEAGTLSAVPAAAAPPRLSMLRVRADLVDRLVNEAGEVAIARSRIEGETRALRAAMVELTDNVARLRTQLREIEIQAESQMQSRVEHSKSAREEFDPLQFDRFTRFQELTRLMAESVNDVQTVQQNLLAAMDNTDTALAAQARLNRDLQQDLMRVRMLPLASVADRLHRVVRQTAKELGKRASLDINGGQVELDRSVLERIVSSLEHMLRNCVAHGIESPEARAAAGKSQNGGIGIDVSQEGNEVLLAIFDNGAGLDLERIRKRAQAKNLIAGQSTLTDAEIADFIFLPGFTTADVVTEVSGRGVGMDVVRSEVASLGGRIEISTERGRGTRFRVFLPLTLAVTQAVLLKCAGQTFAIPAAMVEQVEQAEEARVLAARSAKQLEWQGRRYAYRELATMLGLGERHSASRRACPILYLRSGASTLALEVDEMISSSQEVVVKTIGPQLARVRGVAGATVLGDGEVVLILNPVVLAERAEESPADADARPGAGLSPLVLVVDDSLTVRKITGRLLERQGYRVATARDGVEALASLAAEIPDVMLVDVEMPRMDGFDLTRNVRGDARLAAIPIIMISSRTAEKHQQYARDIGVDHFLGKPYQEDELLRHVAGFIAAVRSSEALRE